MHCINLRLNYIPFTRVYSIRNMGIGYSFVYQLPNNSSVILAMQTLHKLRLLIRDELAKHMCYASESQGTGFNRQR